MAKQELPRRQPEETLAERAEHHLERIQELPPVREALHLLEEGLPGQYPDLAKQFDDVLPYHGKHHAEDVLREALFLAAADGSLSEREADLLGIAAAFHDTGFIKQYDENEAIGAQIAAEAMRNDGSYRDEEITRVRNAILGTQVTFDAGFRQEAGELDDPIAKLLADADVGNFGRSDFEEKADRIFQELVALGKLNEDGRSDFDAFRLKMLEAHDWHTDAARTLREEQKTRNTKQLRATEND